MISTTKLLSFIVVTYAVLGIWTMVSAHHQPECQAKANFVRCTRSNKNSTYYDKESGTCKKAPKSRFFRIQRCTKGGENANSFNSTEACDRYCNHETTPVANSTTTVVETTTLANSTTAGVETTTLANSTTIESETEESTTQ